MSFSLFLNMLFRICIEPYLENELLSYLKLSFRPFMIKMWQSSVNKYPFAIQDCENFNVKIHFNLCLFDEACVAKHLLWIISERKAELGF